jgi:RES domain
VILHRCFAWDRRAAPDAEGGPLWFARAYQGDGRHDNPDAYGCLYLAVHAVSAVVEQLARFRGSVLVPQILLRRRIPLALAILELDDISMLVDLDDPTVLSTHALRPSTVATRTRHVTQPQALALYQSGADGIRWWSTFESLWANVTAFDRTVRRLRVGTVRRLSIDDVAVREAADFLGIAPA